MMSTKRDLYQRELSVDDVYDVLQTLGYRIDNPSAPSIEISTVPRMDMQGLMESMCVYYDISPEDILGTSRKRNIVRARQLLMYLAKEELDWTYERIGEFCGGKNHATVIHAIKTMKKLIRSDEYLKADYVKLKEGL
jgi:chromosomal replication initiator protein